MAIRSTDIMLRRHLLGLISVLPLAFGNQAFAANTHDPEIAATNAKKADGRSLFGLNIKDEYGHAVPLTAHAGKLLIINLWGPWCVPCRREMPSLSRLNDRLASLPAVLLPVAFDRRGAESVRQFYSANNIGNLPILTGDGENLLAITGKSHLPLTLIADSKGNWIFSIEGEAVWDDDETFRWLEQLAKV